MIGMAMETGFLRLLQKIMYVTGAHTNVELKCGQIDLLI